MSQPMAHLLLQLPYTDGTDKGVEGGSIFFIGNATVLMKYCGFTILTDPNFLHKGDHVHLGFGIHAERITNPAMEMNDLPHVDFIVLSHLHEDHFDKYVEEHLDRSIPIITTYHAASGLKEKGFTRLFPLHTWERILVVREGSTSTVAVTSMPGQHAPASLAQAAHMVPPVMGSLLEFAKDDKEVMYRTYLSGDTLVYEDLHDIPKRYPDINLGLFHLGGTTLPMGVMVTMDGKQGVEAIRIINPHRAIPIHYNDYDRFLSPLEDFKKEVEASSLSGKVSYLSHGDTYEFKTPSKEAPENDHGKVVQSDPK